jgi:predicted permease
MLTATDIRYALRVLLAAPTFAIVAVTTLALGIGLNVTVFSILDVVLFKPVPVQHAAELVWIAGTSTDGNRYRVLPYPDLIEFGGARTAVRDVAGMATARVAVGAGGQSLRLTGQVITGNYFDVLGVAAGAGRTLGPGDDTSAADGAVTVLSDTTARRLFSTARDAVGETIELNGQRVTVVGVAPLRFAGVDALRPVDLWVPLSMANQVMTGLSSPLARGNWWLAGIGRLAEGVDRRQAQAVLSGVAAAIAQAHPESHKNVGVALYEFRGTNPEDRGEFGALAFLPAVPLAVLLIACANVASLLMARGVGRQREMAIRTALGAGRWQIFRQLLTESLLLAFLGGVGSLLLSLWSPELLLRFANADRMSADFTPDGRVILFAVAISSLTAIAFGLLPAVRISKVAPGRSLRGGPGASSGATTPGTARVQRWLVAGQLALSLVLLVATGTFVRSVAAAGRTSPGFGIEGRVTVSLDLKMQRYTAARALAFERELLTRIRSLPGVREATVAQYIPAGGRVELTSYYLPGRPVDPDARPPFTAINTIGTGFFETLQLPLRRGRALTDADEQTPARVVVVNEALAGRLVPDGDAIGTRVILGSPTSPPAEIVGIAADALVDEFGEAPQPAAYLPRRAEAGELSIIAWTGLEPGVALRAIEQEIHALDASLAVFAPRTMAQNMAERMDGERGLSRMLGVAGALALGLAACGLYGVTAYAVSRRTREIGVRVALGAGRRGILQMVLGDAARLAAGGILAGFVPAYLLTYLLSGMIFGVEPTDLRAIGVSTVLLVAAALAASYVPARRALTVDPILALRTE